MKIHLLRHAEAEDASPSGRDADRRLTDAGKKRMRLVAKAIAKMDPKYDAVLVSPLVRSRQTAEPVAAACGFRKTLLETKSLLPNADPEAILVELSRLGAASVLLVGHQPHFGRLLGRLATGRRDAEIPMKKAGLAEIEIDGDPSIAHAELRWLLSPHLLEEMA
ncbi:MAG: phosphohistidine phosphatase SixA [Thermoanaerobaculia bacterium]